MKKVAVFVCWFLGLSFTAQAQINSLDSLLQRAKSGSDSLKAEVYLNLAISYRVQKTDVALDYASLALRLARENELYTLTAQSYHILGAIYTVLGDYTAATASLMEAIKTFELLGNSRGVANSANSLGVLFFKQNDFDPALKYYQKSLALTDSLEKPDGYATYLLNIGEVHQVQYEHEKALETIERAYLIFKQLNDISGMAYSLGIIAKVNLQQSDYREANILTRQAIALFEEDRDYLGMVEYMHLLVEIYIRRQNWEMALDQAKAALTLSKSINSLLWIATSYQHLAEIYAGQNDFERAYLYKDSANSSDDQLLDEQKQRQIANLRIIYESDKKDQENKILKIDQALKKQTIIQQRIVTIAIGICLVVILIFAILAVKAKNAKQKANVRLMMQNDEIRQQREEIETQAERLRRINQDVINKNQLIESKNKDITDSINYAQRIQNALLPFSSRISRSLPDHFIFYKPKDIVSGDFYWFEENDQHAIIAVADCTGHGIPGAFMSFIGHDMLNYIVNVKGVISPDQILGQLKINVIRILRQEQNDNRDGMDISICVWHKKKNLVEFSGANHSLFFIQNRQLHQVKGDKQTIGYDEKIHKKAFTKTTINITADTDFYLFTDGYIDQFGGTQNRKFMVGRFRKLLEAIHLRKMETQGHLVKETIEDWMMDKEQIDDMLILGFRIFEK